MNATAANDNATTSTSTKKGKVVEYRNIKSRDYKRHGTTYPGTVKVGQHADVTPGKSIRLHGIETNRHEPKPHDLTFKVGDTAVHGSYNLVYTGTITSIGAKTVTIKGNFGKPTRMSIYDFNFYNNDYDAERIAARNADTMMCI